MQPLQKTEQNKPNAEFQMIEKSYSWAYIQSSNPKIYMHFYIHSSTIHNSQDMEKPKSPSTDEWMTKMWYVYTIDYYVGIKKECHLQ